MNLPYLVGSGYNQLEHCTSEPVPSAGESGADDVTVLWNGRADEPYIFDGGELDLDIDWNQTVNGDFATPFVDDLPGEGWGSVGTPLASQAGSPGGMQLAGAGGAANYVYFDRRARAGQRLTVSALATPPAGAGGHSLIVVRNLETGATLDRFGNWVPASEGVALWHYLPAALGGARLQTPFTVESYAACLSDRVTIRFEFHGAPGAGSTFPVYNDFFVWPRINIAHFHNHNLPPGAVLEYRSGPIPTPTTAVHTFSIRQPAFYGIFSSQDYRYGRLLLTTPPPDGRDLNLWQLTFAEYISARTPQERDMSEAIVDPQNRSDDVGLQVYLRMERGQRSIDLNFKHPTPEDKAEMKEIIERSRNGALPSVFVVDSSDPSTGLLCQTGPAWKMSRTATTFYGSTLTLGEFPFRRVVS